MTDLNFRQATGGDLAELEAAAARSPGAPQWSYRTWRHVFETSGAGELRTVLIAEQSGTPVGFGVVGVSAEVAEIESLVVLPEHRRQRVGKRLCAELFAWAARNGATRVLLEVRLSNAAARGLYGGLGFVEEGVRRKYYLDPEEDAVVMAKAI